MIRISGLSVLLMACSPAESVQVNVEQVQLDSLGQQLSAHYTVLSNIDDTACRAHIPKGDCFSSQITLKSESDAIPVNTSLFFSHIAPVRGFDTDSAITIEHINGDLHRLTFKESIAAGTEVKVSLSAPFWHASRSDAMPNYYLTYPSLSPVIVASTTRVEEHGSNLLVNQHTDSWQSEAQYKRTASDEMPLMDSAYLADKHINSTSKNEQRNRVIPQVAERKDTGETVSITGIVIKPVATHDATTAQDLEVALSPALKQAAYFGLMQQSDGMPVNIGYAPNELVEGEYTLVVSNSSVEINAKDAVAANYALLTLAQLYNKNSHTLPITAIHDKPRYAFRGMHLDIARHFPGKAAVASVITQMFTYKLNKLHLHLSDDEGWRLAIDALPELTDIGAFRCHDLLEQTCLLPQLGSGPFKSAQGNGYLTQEDYIDILQMAYRRGIEVIPSLDMPGHARAAIVSMNARYKRLMSEGKSVEANKYVLVDRQDTTRYESVQFYSDNTINPCLDSTYTFIDTIMTSVKALHEQAQVPLNYFHVGADETAGAWIESPICKAKGIQANTILPTFVTRVQDIAQKHDIAIGGWSDGMEKAATRLDNSKAYTNVWHLLAAGGENTVTHFAEANIPVVLSFPDALYFDFPYQSNPLEPGYYWGSRATSTHKVFSLMPEHLQLHSQEWTTRMGQSYESNRKVNTSSVVGIQGQLWSEVTVNQDALEYMVFPRLLALAERAWHTAPWQKNAAMLAEDGSLRQRREQDYHAFEHALLNQHAPALVHQNVNVRVPMPAAKIVDGVLTMHVKSGLVAEYQLSSGEWVEYTTPVSVKPTDNVKVRARLKDTQKTSRQALL